MAPGGWFSSSQAHFVATCKWNPNSLPMTNKPQMHDHNKNTMTTRRTVFRTLWDTLYFVQSLLAIVFRVRSLITRLPFFSTTHFVYAAPKMLSCKCLFLESFATKLHVWSCSFWSKHPQSHTHIGQFAWVDQFCHIFSQLAPGTILFRFSLWLACATQVAFLGFVLWFTRPCMFDWSFAWKCAD